MSYADITELRAVLKIASGRDTELQRCLDAASLEIDSELDREVALSDDDDATAFELALAAQVCLSRAVDLWHDAQVPLGALGLGGETPLLTPRNSWERHANLLAPLKQGWGVG